MDALLPVQGRRNGRTAQVVNPTPAPSTSLSRLSRSAWCLGIFFLLIIGINGVAYLQYGNHVEHLYIMKPVNPNVVREWKDYHVIEDVIHEDQDNLSSSDTSFVFSKTKAASLGRSPTTPPSAEGLPHVDSYNPTDVQNTFFRVKNANESAKYRLCDTLELHIEARDANDQPKLYGGDYFWVKMFSTELYASQPADEIIDHQNGLYTARFKLHWTGTVHVQVLLIKSSEYVALLRDQRTIAPARFAYDGKFQLGSQMEIMPCHITKDMFLGALEPQRDRGFCDYTDRRLGYPWFCLKPAKLPCSSLMEHMGSLPRGHEYNKFLLRDKPASVIHSFAIIKQTGPTSIEVIPREADDTVSICTDKPLPPCTPGLPPRPPHSAAGFYYQHRWQSLVCQARDFHLTGSLKCLQGRSMYLYGDSTLRQWFEYLSSHLGFDMREETPGNRQSAGPRKSRDKIHDIFLLYRHHGFPIRNIWTKVSDIKYAANEIDQLPGGKNTVILLSFWAHFTPTNLQFYRERWRAIKGALGRLNKRAPGTPIIVKSANTREQQSMDMSNWYAMELDKVMREELSGEPGVAIIDVWDMTLSHSTGYHIHPLEVVISQEIKMLLNFLCPNL